jgi:hypothetical protein
MTGFWTDDRHALAAGIDATYRQINGYAAADHLIDTRVVRVLDPDDTELRAKIRGVISDEFGDTTSREDIDRVTDTVIEALRQP